MPAALPPRPAATPVGAAARGEPAVGFAERLEAAALPLSTRAVRAMGQLPWFAALSAEQRSYVGLVVQAGLATFAAWARDPQAAVGLTPQVFAAAPRELARSVTLKQTVTLIRAAVDVAEQAVAELATSPEEAHQLTELVLRYSREVAFAAADVYAAAAEARGAWDARVEAGVVEALVRGAVGELTATRAAALGWPRTGWVTVLATRAGEDPAEVDVNALRAVAAGAGVALLAGTAGPRRLWVLGGPGPAGTHDAAVTALVAALPAGPVVRGPDVTDLPAAVSAVAEALAALAAVPGWPDAPRPVRSAALLVERAVLGDATATHRLVEDIYTPLAAAGHDLLRTASAYVDAGAALEATARALYVHPNTVRHRLVRIHAVTGQDLTDPRQATATRLALVLGRAHAAS